MVFALVLAAVLTGLPSPPAEAPVRTDTSPSGKILAEHFWLEQSVPQQLIGRRQIWLRDAERKSDPKLLFEHQRIAEVLFSADDRWIAINDQPLSNLADVRGFRRVSGLDYKEIEKAHVARKCWALLDRAASRAVSKRLDHTYVYAVRWSPDSRTLLLAVQGHTGNDIAVKDWLCVFDVEHLKASTDLRLMNRGAVYDQRRP
jgi:hypothetical protein